VELDSYLSILSRRTASRRVVWRLAGVLRKLYAPHMGKRPNPWITIEDFDGNLKFNVDRSAYIGSLIYWHGWHHYKELKLLQRLLRPEMVFVDVGANQGEFTLFAAKRLPLGGVLAFEPSPASFQHLAKNVALNHCENVFLHPVALGEKAETAELFTEFAGRHTSGYQPNEGLSSMFPSEERPHRVAAVDVKTFDEVFRQSGFSRLDVIKIDVEGAELPVLKGAINSIRQKRPLILVEISKSNFAAAGYTPVELLDFLQSEGYQLSCINQSGNLAEISQEQVPDQCNLVGRHCATR